MGEEGDGITVHVLGMARSGEWRVETAGVCGLRLCVRADLALLCRDFSSSQPRLGERFGRSEATALQAIPQGFLLVFSFLFFLRCVSVREDTGRGNSP